MPSRGAEPPSAAAVEKITFSIAAGLASIVNVWSSVPGFRLTWEAPDDHSGGTSRFCAGQGLARLDARRGDDRPLRRGNELRRRRARPPARAAPRGEQLRQPDPDLRD